MLTAHSHSLGHAAEHNVSIIFYFILYSVFITVIFFYIFEMTVHLLVFSYFPSVPSSPGWTPSILLAARRWRTRSDTSSNPCAQHALQHRAAGWVIVRENVTDPVGPEGRGGTGAHSVGLLTPGRESAPLTECGTYAPHSLWLWDVCAGKWQKESVLVCVCCLLCYIIEKGNLICSSKDYKCKNRHINLTKWKEFCPAGDTLIKGCANVRVHAGQHPRCLYYSGGEGC